MRKRDGLAVGVRNGLLVSAAFWCLLGYGAWAVAQAVPQSLPGSRSLTMQQVEDVMNALRALDAGSADQCVADAKAAAAPTRSCQFRKSPALLRAVARDIVALQGLDTEFKIQQNAVKLAVLGDSVSPTPSAQQDAKFFAQMSPILKEARATPPLAMLKMADFDLGEPPDHNRIPATWLAALAPVISDFPAQ